MIKRIMKLCMVMFIAISLVGCGESGDKPKSQKSSDGTKIKTVADFSENPGFVKYFTVEDKKFSLPETVGEYVNYLEQIGKVTLNATGNSPKDETLKANGVSSMVAYLNVELDNGDEERFYVRYENTSDEEITVDQAKITRIEMKYDKLSEQDYEKNIDSFVFYFKDDVSIKMNGKTKLYAIYDDLGDPEQATDGRLRYSDDQGYKYILDCCTENATGIFRGIMIEYPTK